jgi:hypothetical protein
MDSDVRLEESLKKLIFDESCMNVGLNNHSLM